MSEDDRAAMAQWEGFPNWAKFVARRFVAEADERYGEGNWELEDNLHCDRDGCEMGQENNILALQLNCKTPAGRWIPKAIVSCRRNPSPLTDVESGSSCCNACRSSFPRAFLTAVAFDAGQGVCEEVQSCPDGCGGECLRAISVLCSNRIVLEVAGEFGHEVPDVTG